MKTTPHSAPLRCAIYTRKSTEEGLEQSFNSLDAQREACESYIASQHHEGWQLLKTRYDDGGFSGGTLERPALQRLLNDIAEGEIDLVVVYKIDRLTRSLMDFAKLVEVFDRNKTSFVSVTQQFNTTSSMGRLTLNVLLSFAQFEREVTGERIRDKIAASKRKGMWMGGQVPLGYAVVDHKLVIHSEEAARVKQIFDRYCALRCVHRLHDELLKQGFRGRERLQRNGKRETRPFSRGALYVILKNRLYLGEITHKEEVFKGLHPAIISKPLWDKAQAILRSNWHDRKRGNPLAHASLLAGMIVNGEGKTLSPSHTTKKDGKRYRYYLDRPIEPRAKGSRAHRLCLPAYDIERIATEQWLQLLTAKDLDVQLGIHDAQDSAKLREHAQVLANRWSKLDTGARREVLTKVGFQVRIDKARVEIGIDPAKLAKTLLDSKRRMVVQGQHRAPQLRRVIEASLIKAGGETRVVEEATRQPAATLSQGQKTLLKAIAQGREWAKQIIAGEIDSVDEIRNRYKLSYAHVARGLKCLRIPPDVVSALVEGRTTSKLNWLAVRPLEDDSWDMAIRAWRDAV